MADVTISGLDNLSPAGSSFLPISTGSLTGKTTIASLPVDYNSITNKPNIPVVNNSQLAKAWVCFNGQGSNSTNQLIKASFNVTSVYKNGSGSYTVNFTPGTFANGNIVVVGTFMHVPNVSWGGAAVPNAEPTASSATIFTGDHGKGLVNSAHVSVVFF